MSTQDDSKQGTGVPETGPANASDDIKYESALKPLMWLLIPLLTVLIYAALTN